MYNELIYSVFFISKLNNWLIPWAVGHEAAVTHNFISHQKSRNKKNMIYKLEMANDDEDVHLKCPKSDCEFLVHALN